MSEQTKIAFEAKFPVPDGIWFHKDGDYINKEDTPNEYNNIWHTWSAATAEANKRIESLEALVRQQDIDDANWRKQVSELQANNHDLREAFNDLAAIVNRGRSPSCKKGFVDKCRCTTCVIDRVSASTAESLQAHDDELIEKCAKVCDDDSLESRLFAEPFAAKCAELLAEAIRNLKEVK